MHTGDLGFRAYLHTISDKISSWTKEQEAFYQAKLLSNEIKMATQETYETPKSETSQKGPNVRKKTKANVKGKTSISKGDARSETVAEKKMFGENGEYIVEGSLKDELRKKALQQQQQLKAEAERALTITDKATRTKSGKGKTESKHVRSPAMPNDSPPATKADEEKADEPQTEQFWPFTGYDLTETVAHFDFQETSMFPCDGGSIRIQKIHQPHGDTSVKVTAITEGHTFACHRLLPNPARVTKRSPDGAVGTTEGEGVKNGNKVTESGENSHCFEEEVTYFTTYFSANLSNGICLARAFEAGNTSPEEVRDSSTTDLQKKLESSGPICTQHFKLNLSTPEGCQMQYLALRE
nr:unnamed protein product [Spirometra erinaceieuropaei]